MVNKKILKKFKISIKKLFGIVQSHQLSPVYEALSKKTLAFYSAKKTQKTCIWVCFYVSDFYRRESFSIAVLLPRGQSPQVTCAATLSSRGGGELKSQSRFLQCHLNSIAFPFAGSAPYILLSNEGVKAIVARSGHGKLAQRCVLTRNNKLKSASNL